MTFILFILICFKTPAADHLLAEKMVSQSEIRAIKQLRILIKRHNGSAREPDLRLRLAELHVKRSKTQRFFEFQSMALTPAMSSKAQLQQALKVYFKIERDFPNYPRFDHVLFNAAFVLQKLGKTSQAQRRYQRIVTQLPNSKYLYDSHLALAELHYDKKNFRTALKHYRIIEALPELSITPYAIYKSAWSHYNLQNSKIGIGKLEQLLKNKTSRFHLRQEALRDLVLFFDEVYSVDTAYRYFKSITQKRELALTLTLLSDLYISHDKHIKIPLFLKPYLIENLGAKDWPVIQAKLISTYDKLNRHQMVLDELSAMQSYCFLHQCSNKVSSLSMLLIKSWDQKKSKKHKLHKLFEIYLANENNPARLHPVHFAYAEYLVQSKAPDQAVPHYIAAAHIELLLGQSAEKSLYSSIIAMEMNGGENTAIYPITELESHIVRFSGKYPDSPHVSELRYHIGISFYKTKHFQKSLEHLALVTKGDYLRQAEDLSLDALNALEKYSQIIDYCKKIIAAGTSKSRTTELAQLSKQAEYMIASTSTNNEKIEKLYHFANKHRDSKLGVNSYLQAIKLAKTQDDRKKLHSLSLEFSDLFKDVSHAQKYMPVVLNELAQSYEKSGNIKGVADALIRLYEHEKQFEVAIMAAEHLVILDKTDSAILLYKKVLTTAKGPQKAKLYIALSKLGENYSSELVSLNIQPYPSKRLLNMARAHHQKGDNKSAFSLCRKIVSLKNEVSASARFLQSKILIQEFQRQSLKARADRFELVISLKIEKFDKAQRALISTIHMADLELSIKATHSLIDLQSDFKSSLSNIAKPDQMNIQDFNAVTSQFPIFLENISTPEIPDFHGYQTFANKIPSTEALNLRENL